MNITQGLTFTQRRRFRSSQFIIAFVVAIALTAIIGADPLGGDSDGRTIEAASPVPALTSQVQSDEPDTQVTSESQRQVPDFYKAGFREPANLRERLQAGRGEFSRTSP